MEVEEDGVWAVEDNSIMSDWVSNDDSDVDAYLLNVEGEDFPEEENQASAEVAIDDEELMRSFVLNKEEYCRNATPEDPDELPGLQSVTRDSGSRYDAYESDTDGFEVESNWELENGTNDSIFWRNPPRDCGLDAYSSFAGPVLKGDELTRRTESDLYDSGASRHMTPFRHRLTNFTSIQSKPITAADKRIFLATGKGDMRIELPNGSGTTKILVKWV